MGNFFFFLIANLLQRPCITSVNSRGRGIAAISKVSLLCIGLYRCLTCTQNTATGIYAAHHLPPVHRLCDSERKAGAKPAPCQFTPADCPLQSQPWCSDLEAHPSTLARISCR